MWTATECVLCSQHIQPEECRGKEASAGGTCAVALTSASVKAQTKASPAMLHCAMICARAIAWALAIAYKHTRRMFHTDAHTA